MFSHRSRILAVIAAVVLFVSVHSVQRGRLCRQRSGRGQECIRAGAVRSLCQIDQSGATPDVHGRQSGARPLHHEQPAAGQLHGAGHRQRLPEQAHAGGFDGRQAGDCRCVADRQARRCVPNGWIRSPGRVAGNELDAELPPPKLPEGAGKAIVEAKCNQCHFLHRLTQMRWTHDNWEQEDRLDARTHP